MVQGHCTGTRSSRAGIFILTQPYLVDPICLDPSPSVFKKATIKSYNRLKYSIPQKRTLPDEEVPFIVPDAVSSTPDSRFNQLAFIEEWRRNRKAANEEILVGLGDKTKIKLRPVSATAPPVRKLIHNNNRRIVRTLRFESGANAVQYFHVLNVYERTTAEFEAVLRWGTSEGTAIDGGTMKFQLGVGKDVVEFFCAQFKTYYGTSHTLMMDSCSKVSTT